MARKPADDRVAISLRFTPEMLQRIKEKRFREGMSFQEVGERLFAAWLADPERDLTVPMASLESLAAALDLFQGELHSVMDIHRGARRKPKRRAAGG